MNICIRIKKVRGPILLELLPFVILDVFCLCIESAYARKSTCTTAFAETIGYFAYTIKTLVLRVLKFQMWISLGKVADTYCFFYLELLNFFK